MKNILQFRGLAWYSSITTILKEHLDCMNSYSIIIHNSFRSILLIYHFPFTYLQHMLEELFAAAFSLSWLMYVEIKHTERFCLMMIAISIINK